MGGGGKGGALAVVLETCFQDCNSHSLLLYSIYYIKGYE